MNKGSLEVICGSMFSGKTEELMRRLKRAEYAKQHVLTIKHHIDDRGSYSCIMSHAGTKRQAHPLKGTDKNLEKILTLARNKITVVGIDEIQFFPKKIIRVICTLIDRGKRVITAGLDLNFRGEPFETTSILLAIADKITKLRAICVICGNEASYSQRIINGMPAKYNDPVIMIGASESYEARCRNCFQIDIPPKPNLILKQDTQ